jgi:UDP-glucose 4-epimerase
MERILVTGGAGFIGSHVTDNLRGKGKGVTILDRRIQKSHRDDLSLVVGDVKDRSLVEKAVAEHDGVIHLAAILGTMETIENAAAVTDVNIHGSLNVFDACKQYRKKAVYIAVGNHWMNNPYSITKTAAERFALMYNKEFKTHIAVVRGLNAYGPRQKSRPVRKVVPNFVIPALRGEDLVIFGSGKQIMDLIYVEDIAEILVRALLMDHGVYDRIFEAGMGRDTTINELADLVIRTVGSSSGVKHVQMRPGEEPDSIVKANVETLKCLDYSAQDMTPLDVGMRKTVEWYAKDLASTRSVA